MRYVKATEEQFSDYVNKNNKKVILFGSGAVCKTYIPYIFLKYNLCDKVMCIIDNNTSKQGNIIRIGKKEVPVKSIRELETNKDDFCILITNGEFESVMRQLDTIRNCDGHDCFISAIMQLDREYKRRDFFVWKDYNEPQIPKIINYCWFSGNPIPMQLKKCIDTWREKCPEYDIVRWDESNFDVSKYKYTKEAYYARKWGYIPDIVRLEILYEVGGFYFDTDVEIIKNIDELRYQSAFCGRERAGHINFGGGSGSVPHNKIIKEILDFRKDIPFDMGNGKYNLEASGYYETEPLVKYGLVIEDINQKLDGINVYSSDFFSPYNYINGENIRNSNTFSIHHFNGSWIDTGDRLRKETRDKYSEIKAGLITL